MHYEMHAGLLQAAALAGGRWLGKGDKNAADQAAVDQMRKVLNSVAMDGVVVIGEGVHMQTWIRAGKLHCSDANTAWGAG
jgi:fructose-1,6-bisphosphatase/sedoheptulose 1,7-bisphosphatase-like protein